MRDSKSMGNVYNKKDEVDGQMIDKHLAVICKNCISCNHHHHHHHQIFVFVLTKTRNDLKSPRNYLKPPETSHVIVFFT